MSNVSLDGDDFSRVCVFEINCSSGVSSGYWFTLKLCSTLKYMAAAFRFSVELFFDMDST
ncbi:hypothetical protein TYRP_013013 [Tyrophagus putrescentiae]|nr:hypothetical protein TYRP_013013 [Tyrophagus putrescentiae]